MSDDPTAATAAALEAASGHRWSVWLSDTGTWWAARTARLTAEQLTSGCVPFLRANDPDELRRELEHAIEGTSADTLDQAELRRKLDEVLAEQKQRVEIRQTRGAVR